MQNDRNHYDVKDKNKISHNYHSNTKEIVFSIADMGVGLVQDFKNKLLKPVIMIDGPAGTGKSSFAKDLVARLKELEINVCFFEQDCFGVFRDIRANNKINPCSDLARDPKTIDKLKDVMAGKTAQVPSYNTVTGVRVKDSVSLPSGDLIIYEGISSLSAVIYDNSEFDEELKNAVAIKIFFRPDCEETLFNSRLKRDREERNVSPLTFTDNWDDSRRNNWIYTMRGITNANFVVTRTHDNKFLVTYLTPVISSQPECIKQIPNSVYTSLQPKERALKLSNFRQERHDVLKQNLNRWFDDYHISLLGGFIFQQEIIQKQECKVDRKNLIKIRDELINYFLSSLNPERNISKTSFAISDDNIVAPKKLLRAFHQVFFRINNAKPNETLDDLICAEKFQYRSMLQHSLFHDARFNPKNKIALENALAAVVMDNIHLFAPSINKVTKKMLECFAPLVMKFISGNANENEQNVVRFLIAPFRPDSPDCELGRMLIESKDKKSEIEVVQWLITSLCAIEKNNYSFFTCVRFHIRFMHLIAEQGLTTVKEPPPSLPEDFIPNDAFEKIKKLNLTLRPDVNFDPKKMRGRKIKEKMKQKLTTSFGTYVDIHDLPSEFRKLIGLRSLPPHSAGKTYIQAITSTEHNKKAFEQDLPLIASVSGAMPFFMCAADYAELKEEDLQFYHLAAITNMIAGGHHSLAECLAVSLHYFNLEHSTIAGLIPDSLKKQTEFAELIRLSNRSEFNNLAVNLKNNTCNDLVIAKQQNYTTRKR